MAQVFSCEFGEILKNTFFIAHLWTTAPDFEKVNLSKICIKSCFKHFHERKKNSEKLNVLF